MTEACIKTYTGIRFDMLEPRPEMVVIEDIAHALSQLCRFTGHTKYFYSVSQHAYYASYLTPAPDALWALLHDASEAYLGDMNRPLKHFTAAGAAYLLVEEKVQNVICDRFGLDRTEPASVKEADNAMLRAEKDTLMMPITWDSPEWEPQRAQDVEIVEWTPRMAESRFLRRFRELTSVR